MSLFKKRLRSVPRNTEQAINEIVDNAISMQDDLERSYQTIEKKLKELDDVQKELSDALAALAPQS